MVNLICLQWYGMGLEMPSGSPSMYLIRVSTKASERFQKNSNAHFVYDNFKVSSSELEHLQDLMELIKHLQFCFCGGKEGRKTMSIVFKCDHVGFGRSLR